MGIYRGEKHIAPMSEMMLALLQAHPFFATQEILTCVAMPHQGYCNLNYLVSTTKTRFIARKLLREDIDREQEWHILQKVYQAELTAEPLVFDREQGFMVFAFVEGEHKTELGEDDLKQLAQVLQKVHAIPCELEPMVLELEAQSDTIKEALATIAKYPKAYALCHNDLNRFNVLFSDKVKLIDWEYAGMNDRYFDLASVCVEFGLDETQQTLFMGYYGETPCEQTKLHAYMTLYSALCAQWFEENL